jgi:[acyl-carrier-protein] S-malonyltransferase
VTGVLLKSGKEAKDSAVRQIVSTVRWVDEEMEIIKGGVTRCIEAGPGTVLGGLWKSVSRDIRCYPSGNIEQIKQIGE